MIMAPVIRLLFTVAVALCLFGGHFMNVAAQDTYQIGAGIADITGPAAGVTMVSACTRA